MKNNKIIMDIIPQQVRVRKYEVNTEELKEVLKIHKKNSKLTINEISVKLNKPKTLVEHWFRGDSCFSIPDEDIWYQLKELLNIETNKFDESITTFEIRDGVYEKSNRVYDANGIAPTLTCASAETERYKFKNKGVDVMWKNNLEKFNFKMEEIRIFDIFAGIGALHKSLSKLGVPVRITNLSEVDIDAIISYSGIHIENFKDLEFEYPSIEEMREWLINRNIGYDFEKGKSKIPRLNKDKLKLLYKGSYLLKNLGDVSQIDSNNIEDFDIMNLSFCCQDISNAGKQKGLRNEDGTPTRSGLIVPSLKLARAKKPKYIMIENVKALIQKKFIDDFYDIINELNEMGYNCYYPTKEDKKGNLIPTCLNSKNFGIAQNRERIFVIAIRKDIDNGQFTFNYGYDMGIRLKHMLEENVDEKYYLSPQIQEKISNWNAYQRPFENVLGNNSISPTLTARGAGEYHSGMIVLSDELEDKTNLEKTCDKDFPIICEQRCDEGLRFFKDNICGALRTIDACGDKRVIENGAIRGRYNSNGKIEQQLELRNDGVINTLTTVEKDNVILEREEIKIRKLTPLECWRLQGFDDSDFYKAQELGISDSALYKQAGNSITVNVLYYQFKNLFKEYIVE